MNRFITRKGEWGSWPVGNINSGETQVSDAGIIEGFEGITQGIGLDVAPYLISGFDTKRGNKTKYKINGGTDVFYQVTPSLKASVSINTDFAETEADSRQINLTRFSLRLNEKRNFFLDGSNYFNFGIEGFGNEAPSGKVNPFFSRKIGLNGDGTPIPVNYGAKLTGNIKNWNIGIMNVSDVRDYGNSNDSIRNNLTGLDLKLATSKFMRNKRLALTLFGLKATTDDIHGKDISWGGTFAYPNDLVNFRIGHVEIGENFIAGMGYVPRTNIKETFGSLTLGPRLNKWGIRQYTFGGSFDYVTDFANRLQSKDLGFSPIGIRFISGEVFSYNLSRRYDFVESDFNIYSNFIIPPAEYQWWENQFSFSTLGSRSVYGRASYGFGNFYTGRKNTYALSANWKVAIPFFIGGTYTSNKVTLPAGEFTANIYQFNANILFSPNITLYNFWQFDSQSKAVGWQSRFQWILKPGNEILFVWNSGFSKPLEHYVMNESAMRFKLKYNIRF